MLSAGEVTWAKVMKDCAGRCQQCERPGKAHCQALSTSNLLQPVIALAGPHKAKSESTIENKLRDQEECLKPYRRPIWSRRRQQLMEKIKASKSFWAEVLRRSRARLCCPSHPVVLAPVAISAAFLCVSPRWCHCERDLDRCAGAHAERHGMGSICRRAQKMSRSSLASVYTFRLGLL